VPQDDLLNAYTEGSITRRQLFRRFGALGIAAGAAIVAADLFGPAALAQTDDDQGDDNDDQGDDNDDQGEDEQ